MTDKTPSTYLSQFNKEQLIEMNKTMDMKSIGESMDMGEQQIRYVFRKLGIKPVRHVWNKGRKMTEEERLTMIEAVKNGWTEDKREAQKKRQKEIWSNPELRAKSSEIAYSLMTEEHRKKISDRTKEAMSRPEVHQKLVGAWNTGNAKIKMEETCMEKYGVPYPCMLESARSGSKAKSNINHEWKELLGLTDDDMEFNLGKYVYDLKFGDTLIEINPTYSHNSTFVPWYGDKKGKKKEPLDHMNKSKHAEDNGFDCVHIWDWDDADKVVKMFSKKVAIGARQCEVRLVEDVTVIDVFLNTYHLQNTCKGQSVCVGLYYEEGLVGLMTFGKPRYNSNYEWELLRLCFDGKYTVMGGAKKMFKWFVEHYNPLSIISYCDKSKFSGKVYVDLGFELLSYAKPSKHWYNIKTKRHITDNLLRQRGFSQLHGDKEHKKGEDNRGLMLEHGYVEVYDCGQASYGWVSCA